MDQTVDTQALERAPIEVPSYRATPRGTEKNVLGVIKSILVEEQRA